MLHWIDWTVIGAFMLGMVGVGIYFSKKAGSNVDSFFVSGRSLKWYVAGASMIATSFAADTPLWVSAAVREFGIQAAWSYWAPLIGSALGVVLFSRMWRRSGVTTDNEILELRYDGNAAKALRGITAGAMTLLFCPLIIGWVSKAMVTISQETMGLNGLPGIELLGMEFTPELIATFIVMTCALLLCAFSGLYGVVYTDFIQFIVATAGTFILAGLAIKEVGGFASLYEQLSNHETWQGKDFNFVPNVHTEIKDGPTPGSMSIWNIIGFFGLLWWGVALSGGYQAQRILACKDANHASNAMLTHTIVYYAIISFPWILVALASIILIPDLEGASQDSAYPKMIMKVLPIGLCGMMVAAMIAAFISTMSTLFNWGSSYIVNDLYRRFMNRKASDKHYVTVARLVTVGIAILGGIISYHSNNIIELLMIFWVAGSGLAALGVIRWLWWRVNAIGELSGFVATFLFVIILLKGHTPFTSPDNYQLKTVTVQTQEQLPTAGKSEFIIAKVLQPVRSIEEKETAAKAAKLSIEELKPLAANQLYIRIFDPKGRKDVDSAEATFETKKKINELKSLVNYNLLVSVSELSKEQQNEIIEMTADMTDHTLAEPVLDAIMGPIFGLKDNISFSQHDDLNGARMLALTIIALVVAIIASLLTKPTDIERLKEFAQRTRIFNLGWRKVTNEIPGYQTAHPLGTTVLDWALVVATVCSLLFAMNTIIMCKPLLTTGLFALFIILLVIVLKRTNKEETEEEQD